MVKPARRKTAALIVFSPIVDSFNAISGCTIANTTTIANASPPVGAISASSSGLDAGEHTLAYAVRNIGAGGCDGRISANAIEYLCRSKRDHNVRLPRDGKVPFFSPPVFHLHG